MFRRLKISTQLIILFGLVMTLSVILSTSFALFSQSQSLRSTLEERGTILSKLTARFLITPLYFNDVDNVNELASSLTQNEDVTFAIVERAEDATIVGQIGDTADISDEVRARVVAFAQARGESVLIDTPDQLLVAVPIGSGSVNVGTLIIGLSFENMQNQLQAAAIQLASFALVWVVLGLVGTVLIARFLSEPINTLTRAAQAVSQGNYDVSFPPASSQELNTLTETFEQMVDQLQNLIGTLETQVATRTQRLEIVAQLSEQLNTILDVAQVSAEVVNQVQENFGYYHAHIYLFDDAQENLVVTAGTGSAGAEMKARGHSIPRNAPTSLVARAARSSEIVRVDNVREAADWLPNPLLPNTYSEMAVPVVSKNQVVGVLDVQEDKIGGLDEGDANVLRSLANAVGVAIDNAALFQEVEAGLARAEAAQAQYVAQAWQTMRSGSQGQKHHYAQPHAPVLDETIINQAEAIAATEDQVSVVTLKTGQAESIVSPIVLHNHSIGTIQLHPDANSKTWSEDDLAIVQAVIDQLAQSAENLRLFDETRQRAGQEQTLREITEKMRQAPNLETLTKMAGEELAKVLNATEGVIKLGVKPNSNLNDGQAEQNGADVEVVS